MKPFEIFRPGTHTASNGVSLAFADSDVLAIAKGYDPKLHHAPIVVGHPKQDNPAYGWIDSLTLKDGRLVAAPADVDPQFADLVKQRRFAKVSAAFYSPDSANNPKPGSYYLRHVGFLGAAAPAVKGLKPVEFAAGDDGGFEVEIAFSDAAGLSMRTSWALDAAARLFRGLRERLIATESVAAADEAVPDYEIESLSRTANDLRAAIEADDKPLNAYADPKEPTMKTKAELDAEHAASAAALTAREQAVAQRETEFAEREQVRRAEEDAAFVDLQVAEGRLPAGLKGVATALFSALNDAEITFADADGTKSANPRLALQGLLSALPKPVLTGEIVKGGEEIDFADPAQAKSAIENEMAKAVAAGKPISAAEAASKLKKEG